MLLHVVILDPDLLPYSSATAVDFSFANLSGASSILSGSMGLLVFRARVAPPTRSAPSSALRHRRFDILPFSRVFSISW